MNRKQFKDLLEQYISDGFNRVDIELGNGEVISFNSNTRKYSFKDGYFFFGGNGLNITIDYRIIKSISI